MFMDLERAKKSPNSCCSSSKNSNFHPSFTGDLKIHLYQGAAHYVKRQKPWQEMCHKSSLPFYNLLRWMH